MLISKREAILRALIDSGELTERAAQRYLMPHNELKALLNSEQRQEVTDDLSSALGAILKARRQRA